MSTENTLVATVEDDLDLFSSDFFGQKQADPEPANSEPEETAVEDASNEDTQIEEDTLVENEDDTEAETDTETDDTPVEVKPKKNRFQDRIDKLVGESNAAKRELDAVKAELEALKNPTNANKEPVPVQTEGPSPDDVNEDGSEKYPLGEFDPGYIRDLTKFTIAEERKAMAAEAAAEAERQRAIQESQAVQESWNQKLAPAEERYPDFREKGGEFIQSIEERITPEYSQYLSNVLMEMDYGPDVLYYLANNPDEAIEIVSSGARKATGALYRIEAKFAEAAEAKKTARPKISNAPTPPVHTNKGSAVARVEVPADTDSLDDFESMFFKKTRR